MRSISRVGFTLVELLIVITLIAMLFALMLPSLHRSREMALRAKCGSNLRQVGVAHFVYMTDFSEWLRVFSIPSNFYGASPKLTVRPNGAAPDDYMKAIYPPGLRACPTFTDTLPSSGATMDWYYQHPLLTVNFVQNAMAGRCDVPFGPPTPTPKYVRALTPGIGKSLGNGSTWAVYLKTWDTYGTLPLASDMVGCTTGGTYSAFASAHNGGDPYVGPKVVNGTATYIPFTGTNSVWEDGRVEWHDIGVPGYANTWGGPTHVNYWDVALGTSGSGNARALHTRYDSTNNGYVWAKRASIILPYP